MKHNLICERLGIRYPIIQGGMFWLADARLAAAVSNAGALGTVSPYAGMNEKEDPVRNLRTQIHHMRKWTRKPFAVNILLDQPECGLLADAAVKEGVPAIVTAAGNPETYSELFHAAGIYVFHVIASVAHAKTASGCGIDAVIAEGYEAAGRIGRDSIPLFSLLPQVVDAVELPVVAAGGIVDGRDMAEALAIGAYGVQLGTRFVAVEECPAHPAYKEAVVACRDDATVVTRRSTMPVRSLRCSFTEKLAAMEQSEVPADRIEKFVGRGRARAAQVGGDIENGDAYAGASAGRIQEILPAAQVIQNIIREYETTIAG